MADLNEPTGFHRNDDGHIIDIAAQRVQAREAERANTPPNKRIPDDHTLGTPAGLDENSPKHMHSDGGPTLYTDEQVRHLDEPEKKLKDAERKVAADDKKKAPEAQQEQSERPTKSTPSKSTAK